MEGVNGLMEDDAMIDLRNQALVQERNNFIPLP